MFGQPRLVAPFLILLLLGVSIAQVGPTPHIATQRLVVSGEVSVVSYLGKILTEAPRGQPSLDDVFTTTFSPGQRGVVTFFAFTNSTNESRVRITPENPPAGFGINTTTWHSKTLFRSNNTNATPTTVNHSDQTIWTFEVPNGTALGEQRFLFAIEFDEGNRTVNRTSIDYTLQIAPPPSPPLLPPFFTENPLRTVLILLLIGIGVYYLYGYLSKPKITPRSQTMRAEESERSGAEVVEEKPEEKEIRFLEAKRADVVQSIENARQRVEKGEITEYMFADIKGRKETQLADLDAQIARLRASEGPSP